MPVKPRPGRIAGIDYGTVRIGIAITDAEQTICSPLENYTRGDLEQDKRYFVALTKEERIERFVVGLPVHLSGHESQKSIEARKFGTWLSELTGVPVDYYDERYSSLEAESFLQEAQLTKKRRKKRLDMLAAQIMLSGYLESADRGKSEPGSID